MAQVLRILYSLQELSRGGAERRCSLLANEAARRGHRVRILTDRRVWSYQDMLDPRVELRSIGQPERPSWWTYQRRYWRELREFRPDVFHILSGGSQLVLARLAGAPVVVYSAINIASTTVTMTPRDKFLHQLYMRFTDRLTANSQGVYDSFRADVGTPLAKLRLIPNFVVTEQFPYREAALRAEVRAELGLDEDTLAVGIVARMSPQKGYDDLLPAIAMVADELPHVRWFCAGSNLTTDRAWRDHVEELHRALHLERVCQLLGERTDVPRLLQGFDLFVLASHYEGMPNALLEAMSTGLPAIGTDVSGTQELIVPGETGWLVPPHDPPALAAAMREAASDRERLAAFGEAARRRIEQHYDHRVVVSRFFDLYDEVLAARR